MPRVNIRLPFARFTDHRWMELSTVQETRLKRQIFFFFLTICRQLSAFLSCLLLSFLLYSFSSSSCSRKVHHKRTCCRRKHPVEKKTRNRLTLSSPSNCSSLSPYLLLFSIRKKNRKKRCSQTQSHSLFPSVFSLSLFSVRKKNKKKV